MDAISTLVGNNVWLLVLLLVWVLPWKGVALWKAATREDRWWFIILFIVNTFGILDIFYVFFVARRREDEYEHSNDGGYEKDDDEHHTHEHVEDSLPEADEVKDNSEEERQ